MNTIENIIFIFVLIVGLYALYKAKIFGRKQKMLLQERASKLLRRRLRGISLSEYKIYRYQNALLGRGKWVLSSPQEMEKMVVHNCVKTNGGNGEVYGEAIFSIKIDKSNKVVHYMIGKKNFDFDSFI